MQERFFLTCGLCLLIISTLHADVRQGQKDFAKMCKACHNEGNHIATTKTQAEWTLLMDNEAEALSRLHLSSSKAKDSWGFFNSEQRKKSAVYLKEFLLKYASDSGNADVCG